MSLACTDKMLF